VGGFFVCPLIAVGIAVIIVIVIAAQKAAKRRQEELLALARDLGLEFSPETVRGWDKRWPQFECFARGHSRRAFNLCSGPMRDDPNATQCTLGDYEFKETHSSGKSTQTVTYRFGFLIVETRWRGIPDVLVRRETMLDKFAGVLGFDDIDFESAEFSRKFMVKSRDKRFAYDLIDAQMMEFLLADGTDFGSTPCIDIGDSAVCLWFSQTKKLEPAQFRSLFGWAHEFLRRWPRVVTARLDDTEKQRVVDKQGDKQGDMNT